MERSVGFEPGDLPFEASNSGLTFLDTVEGTLQPGHPAAQGGALSVQPGVKGLEATPPLSGGVGRRGVGAGPGLRHVGKPPFGDGGRRSAADLIACYPVVDVRTREARYCLTAGNRKAGASDSSKWTKGSS